MALRPTVRVFSLLKKQVALRPMLKAKKGQGTAELLDENDPELLEAEEQREAEETLLKQQQQQQSHYAAKGDESFSNLYDALLVETQDPKDLHNIPKHSRLNNLIHHINEPEQVEKMPLLIEQWRNKLLPVTEYTTKKLLDTCAQTLRGDIAYTLLGDRQRYGLLPTVGDFEKTIEALGTQSEMDKAFITLAMVPLYNFSRTGSMYASLVNGCMATDTATENEKVLEDALSAAEELVLDDKIENKADAKDSLEKLAARFGEKGESEKADKVKQLASSL
ncbi:hypothetical protein BDB00DRAFT_786479 [Zychaea mexicana]|uniref:uncharacterized protein n=1 Tax=Zychaea mexicana TaxID=64656 RepID=UPI0022FE2626|nr:uncharacterized protein BDB00DRAFT_786479 [Zychaea mexicana]KAI9495424.1 hypothetical protein BDB00DRAFT_786479 [Zychaea mexicana]